MLQITETAVGHIDDAKREQGVPDEYGVRVSGTPTEDGQVALQIAFAEAPTEGDEVDEQHGTQLFVASDVAEPLSDVEIDVEPETPEGPQLVLRRQPGEEPTTG